MHLTVDGFGGDRELLSNESLVRSLLDRLPGEINMTKITEPHVFRYVGDKAEDWGISGFVLIAESHIAVHTFPERGLIWADVFSCKAFDGDGAVISLAQAFKLDSVRVETHERGLEYPHSIAEAKPVAMYERRLVTGALVGADSH
ncbi:MAG TPA: S-adenosylmethionine decarboxylase [Dehalococcoidia bacterium]|jgi:S-adenosylmethionine decarboxylase|nr:S-adenosylmethionine decarboxylase [Dehalococcoidia bacterium]